MTATQSRHLYNAAEVVDAVQLLVAPGDVTELRILDAITRVDRWPHTQSGYFSDPVKLAESLEGIASAKGIYIIPNAVDRSLLSRAENRLRKTPKGESTQDTNIDRRRWLLIDTDPQRASGISSTDAEHEAALEYARAIDAHLADAGWPAPISADSGNGAHLLYRVDLPTDDGGLIQRCLVALAKLFDSDEVRVDTTVYNPARIWKLYGTLACKGDDTTGRPHRMAKILHQPDELEIVPRELLVSLGGELVDLTPPNRPNKGNGQPFDLQGFIWRNSLDVSAPAEWTGRQGNGTRWTFNTSPLCDHHEGSAHIEQHASGAITAGCHHNSCGWTWQDLRNRFEPRDREQTGQQSGNGSAPEPNPFKERRAEITYQSLTLADLQHVPEPEYFIDAILERSQPGVIAGQYKSLKTTIALELGYCLTTGHKFLEQFEVNSLVNVGMFSGEAGPAQIRNTIARIARSHGDSFPWGNDRLIFSCERLPKIGIPEYMDALVRWIEKHKLELAIIDPGYAALSAIGNSAGNYYMVADLLFQITELQRNTGCTMLLAPHMTKAPKYDPPMLSDIQWSGFSEWAGQWLLMGKRREWDDANGDHWLWFVAGGRSGHASTWGLDVHEGRQDDPEGKVFEVSIVDKSQAFSSTIEAVTEQKERQRSHQQQAEAAKAKDAIQKAFNSLGDDWQIKARVIERTGTSGKGKAITSAWADMLRAGEILEMSDACKAQNGKPCTGYRMNYSNQ